MPLALGGRNAIAYGGIPARASDGTASSGWLLDSCGAPRFRAPEAAARSTFPLVGFDDNLIAYAPTASQNTLWLSPAGVQVGKAGILIGTPRALGADGAVYTLACLADTGAATLYAYGANLTSAWSLDLGAPCSTGAVVLADDGTLYAARRRGGGVEVIAVQTASPGLADTAWPAEHHDNRRTGWLSP